MIVAIMQPTFNPWLGYFDLIDQSDCFVFYDDVQLSKQSWHTRNRIKTANGELFLSIPFVKAASLEEQVICKTKMNERIPWRVKHIKSIENAYRRTPYFEQVFTFLENYYSIESDTIGLFNSSLICHIAQRIGINTKILKSSELPTMIGAKDVRLANICGYLGATKYLSPIGSAVYIEERSPGGALVEAGINVDYHSYQHPIYPQLYGEFIPYLGICDALFNVGFQNCLSLIRSGRQTSVNYKLLDKDNEQ